jgi:hypothetical protein
MISLQWQINWTYWILPKTNVYMKSKTIGRLQEVLQQIDDPNLKVIIDEVFKVEISYRSAERSNFPRQRIRDVVDGVARQIELSTKPSSNNETSENSN